MDLLTAKVICIVLFLFVASLGCSIPYFIEVYRRRGDGTNDSKLKNILACLNCFGAGFIFAIVLSHLLPETILTVVNEPNMKIFNSDEVEMKIVYIFFFMFLGFTVQLALEYVFPTDKHICCVLHETTPNNVEEKYTNNLVESKKEEENIEMHDSIMHETHYHDACENHFFHKKTVLEFLQLFTMQSFFLTISLAIHSIIEGMVVGTASQVDHVFVNSVCILAHKWIAGITVSISLSQNNLSTHVKYMLLLFFIVSSPAGIVLGILAQTAGPKVACIINAVSIGTLLLIGCEILLNEINEKFRRKVRLIKWLCFSSSCTLTFAMIFLTLMFSPYSHIHTHHTLEHAHTAGHAH